TVLRSVFDEGTVNFHGDELTASPAWPVAVPGGAPIPIYVAAIGPKALRVNGELADGTLPCLAGPRTVADFIEPTIAKAAADAGRPSPRVIAAVPVLVTDDVEAGQNSAAEQLSFYETIPSCQKVIAREGVQSAATDIVLSPLDRSDDADRESLWAVAASL
ncbi:MAG: LLM class flavin-dependent oxidoreductase, partial [Mycobacterium sp.]